MLWCSLLGPLLVFGQQTPAPVEFDEGRMSDQTKDDFAALFDENFMQKMVDCQQLAGDTCDVTGMAEYMVQVGQRMQNLVNNCKTDCTHPPQVCKDFWLAFEANPSALRNGCAQTGNWPGVRTVFYRELQTRVADETWELGVMCSMIDAGLNLERMPTCNTLALMTTVNRPTLVDGGCAFATQEECVTNLCDMYSQFAWRMRPRNLIPQAFKVPFDYTYILSGCENVAALDLYSNRAECPKRLDVISFCDCLCPAMSDIQPYDSIQCPVVIDSYLLFGRLGISNWTLDPACDSELCDAFAARRLHPSCAETKLPGPMECLGMQISQVLPENSPCPWKNHSGELNMMECLNGHRCNIATEGWACCENHSGRGKCPLQFPVMCDTLCSGITEYCCREEEACTPRGCPVILEREIFYKEETTTSTSTTEAGRTGALEEQGLVIRLPQGSWVWLLVLVPLAGGIVWFCYIRYKDRKPTVDSDDGEDASIMGMKLDKFGFFKSYKAENKERDDIKPHVCIVMSELPDSRPLGLELMELRVIRVHPWGAKHGWQVGDIIVDIAGHPVKTFEELWDRIQVERNRPPVRFTAERWNVAPTVEEKKAAESLDDQVAAKTMKQRVAEDRENRSKSRIASKNIQEEMAKQAAQPRSLGPNAIPGMMQGYDDDEYEDDEDYSYYSEDDSRVMTAQRVNFPTGRFKSRFTAVFEVIENDKDEETSQHRPGTPNVVIEQKPEKKVKVVVQEEAVDTSKPTDDEKTRVFPVDFERRTFHRDKVVFTKDAWGRSVVKVMNPTQRKPDL